MDEWNLPQSCKLRLTEVQNHGLQEYRLRLTEGHGTTVSKFSKTTTYNNKKTLVQR